jgi:S1-C subfamily serine protease
MNGLDVALLLLLVVVCVRGGRLGGLSQIASYGTAALGLLLGALIAPSVAGMLADGPGITLSLLTLTVLLACLLIAQSIGIAIGMRLRTVAADAGAGTVDSIAGIAVSAVGLVLTVWLLATPLSYGPSQELANTLRGSRMISLIDAVLPTPPDVIARVGTYLDRQGFPEVVSDIRPDVTLAPARTPQGATVDAAMRAARRSVVQVESTGCNSISFGSGFVTRREFVVTNAHVVAGGDVVVVNGRRGSHNAIVVLFDPELDLAVLSVPGLRGRPLPWVSEPVGRDVTGATLGFPGGEQQLVWKPAAVRQRIRALGRDIYGVESVTRDVLILDDEVTRGDSGGPFVTGDGKVAGVVFAAAVSERNTGYALTAGSVREVVADGVRRNEPVGTGACRFD